MAQEKMYLFIIVRLKSELEHCPGKEILLRLCGEYLELLSISDFIRQTSNPIISTIDPQPRNLLQQTLITSSMVPDQ